MTPVLTIHVWHKHISWPILVRSILYHELVCTFRRSELVNLKLKLSNKFGMLLVFLHFFLKIYQLRQRISTMEYKHLYHINPALAFSKSNHREITTSSNLSIFPKEILFLQVSWQASFLVRFCISKSPI